MSDLQDGYGGGLPSWARKGQRVVCIRADESDGHEWLEGEALEEGKVYVVSKVFVSTLTNCLNFQLMGMSRNNASRFYGCEVGYWIARFRPVVELKSDNEIEAQIFRNRKQKQPHSVTRRTGIDA